MPNPPGETREERSARLLREANEAFWAANPNALKFLKDRGSMPHISQMFQSKWITRADVETPVVATIRACTPETFQGRGGSGPETRWILWFHEAKKGLRLNSTNIKTLAEGFGDTTEQWIGQRVRLYVDHSVQMAGQTVGGVRLRCPRAAHPAAFTQPTPAGAFAAQPRQPVNNGAFGPQPNSHVGAFGANVDPTTGEITGRPQAQPHPNAPGQPDPEFDDDIPF